METKIESEKEKQQKEAAKRLAQKSDKAIREKTKAILSNCDWEDFKEEKQIIY